MISSSICICNYFFQNNLLSFGWQNVIKHFIFCILIGNIFFMLIKRSFEKQLLHQLKHKQRFKNIYIFCFTDFCCVFFKKNVVLGFIFFLLIKCSFYFCSLFYLILLAVWYVAEMAGINWLTHQKMRILVWWSAPNAGKFCILNVCKKKTQTCLWKVASMMTCPIAGNVLSVAEMANQIKLRF